ncbi:MAG: family 16 glycosylhydrolase [Eubacterium sp.]
MIGTLKRIIAVVLAFAMTFGIPFYAQSQTVTVQADDEYEIVWEDNFNGNNLDRSIWNVEENGNGGGNQELQYYRDSTENIEVSDGTLKIKGLRKSWGGKNYTSGRINTKGKAEFRYGKIEARMKLPSFLGAWPAFWMLGGNYSSIGWPRCGEIDIMEAINTEKFTHGALHWYGETSQADSGGDTKSIVPADFDRTQWHVYAIEWNEKKIDFLVDGVVFFSDSITDGYKGEFRKEQFIILNLAIGGQWPGFSIDNNAFPATMEVDYVRVSQKASEKNIITGSGVTEKRPDLVPEETVTRNVLEGKGPWSLYFNNAVVKGTGKSPDSSAYVTNIDYLGITPKAIRASLFGIDYIPGETYQYSFNITSSIDKNVVIKVVGEDQGEDVFANYGVSLQAGSTYHFSNNVKIDKNYDGRLDLVIEMGGRIGGEYMSADTSLSINVTDITFVGKVDKSIKVPESPTEKTTTSANNETPTQSDLWEEATTSAQKPGENITTSNPGTKKISDIKLKKVKITKAKRSSNGKKISITLSKIKGKTGCQIRYSTDKKFKKYQNKTTKKQKVTIKKLKSRKTYYIKARAYKIVDGEKIYGEWSKKKKIRNK